MVQGLERDNRLETVIYNITTLRKHDRTGANVNTLGSPSLQVREVDRRHDERTCVLEAEIGTVADHADLPADHNLFSAFATCARKWNHNLHAVAMVNTVRGYIQTQFTGR